MAAPWDEFGAEGGLFRKLSAASESEWRGYTWHPFVQQLADLFDARIVRIEAAGTLPAGSAPPADPAESADGADLPDHASDPDPADPGDR